MACQERGDLTELAGSVKPYGRHAIACSVAGPWGPHIEEAPSLVGRMARDVAAAKEASVPGSAPKLTAAATRAQAGEVDLLVYPEGVAYRGLAEGSWPRVLEEHLLGGTPVADLSPEPLDGLDILVCAHGARDPRCGACGPLVAKALRTEVAARGLDTVRVHTSSHLGGHRFAGNVIILPAGTWYGYVTPADVPAVLDAALAGTVHEPLVRTQQT